MTKEQNPEWGCEVSISCPTCERGDAPPPWDCGVRTFAKFAHCLVEAHKKEFRNHRMKVVFHRDILIEVVGEKPPK